jgi:hypothetical protein
MSAELVKAALSYANRGWRVIALHFLNPQLNICSCVRGAECTAAGKHPRFKKWREAASADPKLLSLWWKQWPLSNVGLTMGGQSGLIAIDIDGEKGRESLAALEAEHGVLPPTLTQSTGRVNAGEHRLFQIDPFYADWIRNRAHVAPSIDIRAEGGLIVAAPSRHQSGMHYKWHDPTHPIAELPKWLFDLALSRREQQRIFSEHGTRPSEDELIASGWPLAKRLPAAKNALRDAAPAVQGSNGSRDCLRAAFLLIRGYCIPPEAAFDLLWSDYNPRCVPPWSDTEIMHKIDDAENAVNNVPWRYRLDVTVDHAHESTRPHAPEGPVAARSAEEIRRAEKHPHAKGVAKFEEPPAFLPLPNSVRPAPPTSKLVTRARDRWQSGSVPLPPPPPPVQLDPDPDDEEDHYDDTI